MYLIKQRTARLIIPSHNVCNSGASSAIASVVGQMSWKRWRVIGVGFTISTSGSSTIAENINFGATLSDLLPGGSVEDYFMKFVQDVTATKQVVNGDAFIYPTNLKYTLAIDPPANGGNHTWTVGPGFGVWQTKHTTLKAIKLVVVGSTFTAFPWYIVEVEQL